MGSIWFTTYFNFLIGIWSLCIAGMEQKVTRSPLGLDPCQTPYPNWLNWSLAWSTNQNHSSLPPSAKTAATNSLTWRVLSVTRKESTPCKSSIAVNTVAKNLLCSLVCSYTNVLTPHPCARHAWGNLRGVLLALPVGLNHQKIPFIMTTAPMHALHADKPSATSKSCCTTSRPEAVSPPRLSNLLHLQMPPCLHLLQAPTHLLPHALCVTERSVLLLDLIATCAFPMCTWKATQRRKQLSL